MRKVYHKIIANAVEMCRKSQLFVSSFLYIFAIIIIAP
nr:MAG TPA: hypothetical protein [Caudoviricetes sp.]